MWRYFKDVNGDVHALLTDGSQDHLIEERVLVPLSPAEVLEHVNPINTLHELATAAMARVNAEYTRRMGVIADSYPLHERESWPVQLQEARLVMDYVDANVSVPETAKTPWLDQCAAQRGITREELAARIVAKDLAYREVSGFLTGVRQRHEDEIKALELAGEASREVLSNYHLAEYWDGKEVAA